MLSTKCLELFIRFILYQIFFAKTKANIPVYFRKKAFYTLTKKEIFCF